MSLADRWGMPLRELLERVDSAELTRWMAFDRVRPPSRAEEVNADLMHWLGRLWMERPPVHAKFLPARHKDPDEPMSGPEMRARLRGL